ncbi:MAG: YchF-related putative GTPase [Candidatus Nanohaloarchaeota archaeon QJJ-7]|nr:YchF-related putative GTPase [Candidatus Nanohaloarchaeota archaeon QJJ-7]
MKLGIVGKPNVGKSTFFRCISDVKAEVGSYPFTTVDPNTGIGYVRVECACNRLETGCDADRCHGGKRFVPVNVSDVAGLVPGAAEGRGMGNEFLDSVREADVLIHVLDVSGRTDEKGEPTEDYDVSKDVEFVENEFDSWMLSLVQDRWDELLKGMRSSDLQPEQVIAEKFSGLGIGRREVGSALDADRSEMEDWGEEELEGFVKELRQEAKPVLYACNKVDVPSSEDNLERLREEFPERTFVPMSAQAELTLQGAEDQGKVEYVSGDNGFKVIGKLTGEQEEGLEHVEALIDRHGGTGVQRVLQDAVFDLLDMIVVYPVEDTGSYEDQHSNVLPDAVLLPSGSTPLDLAREIHSDIAEGYAKAVDAESGRAIGKETELEGGQIVKIETG